MILGMEASEVSAESALEMVERHVREGEEHIAKQKAPIARLGKRRARRFSTERAGVSCLVRADAGSTPRARRDRTEGFELGLPLLHLRLGRHLRWLRRLHT